MAGRGKGKAVGGHGGGVQDGKCAINVLNRGFDEATMARVHYPWDTVLGPLALDSPHWFLLGSLQHLL